MALEFKLPDIGEGIAEGEIVQWLVQPGDAVEEHQPVVEVMTDKATVEVPAPAAGTVTELRAEAGQVVPVGSVIFVLETSGAAPSAAEPATAPATSAPVASAPAPARTVSAETAPAAATAAASGGGGRIDFQLPDIGEGIAEGEIVQWLVAAGDAVEEHQPVVEVMTDKATVEVPAPAAGTRRQAASSEAGDTVVPVGSGALPPPDRRRAQRPQPALRVAAPPAGGGGACCRSGGPLRRASPAPRCSRSPSRLPRRRVASSRIPTSRPSPAARRNGVDLSARAGERPKPESSGSAHVQPSAASRSKAAPSGARDRHSAPRLPVYDRRLRARGRAHARSAASGKQDRRGDGRARSSPPRTSPSSRRSM